MSIIDEINKYFSDGKADRAVSSASEALSGLLSAGIEAAKSFAGAMGKARQNAHDSKVSGMQHAGDGLHYILMRKTADNKEDIFDFFDPAGHQLYRVTGRFGWFRKELAVLDHNGDRIGTVRRFSSMGEPVVYEVTMYGQSFGEIRTLKDRRNFLYDAYGLSIESLKIGFTYQICNNLHRVIATISNKDLRQDYYALTFNDYAEELVIVTIAATVAAARRV